MYFDIEMFLESSVRMKPTTLIMAHQVENPSGTAAGSFLYSLPMVVLGKEFSLLY